MTRAAVRMQVGLIALMAQLGSFVPADACTLTPVLQLHTRMGAADALSLGLSTFAAELTSASEALTAACPRSLILMDELGRGTATNDGAAIAHATLTHIATECRSLCCFTTHHPVVSELATTLPRHVALCHMAVMQPTVPPQEIVASPPSTAISAADGLACTVATASCAAESSAASSSVPNACEPTAVEMLYRVTPGAGAGSFGVRVGAVAGLPPALLESAELHARELERRVEGRRRCVRLRKLAARLSTAAMGTAQNSAASPSRPCNDDEDQLDPMAPADEAAGGSLCREGGPLAVVGAASAGSATLLELQREVIAALRGEGAL